MWHTFIKIVALFCVLNIGAAAYAQTAGTVGIVAVVNDQLISSLDLDERMSLMMGLTGISDTPENRTRLKTQVLHQLVDEALEIQNANQLSITISDAKLQEGIAQIERQNNKPAGSLVEYIEKKGLSKQSFFAQVRAQLAWSEIIVQKIRPRIRISDQEVARYTKKAVNTPRAEEVLIASIQLPVDSPANESGVQKLADKLAGELHGGAQFDAVAAQFSSGTGNTKAPESFWVDPTQLDPAIRAALVKAGKGGITDPIRTASGYQIIKFMDVREVANSQNAENIPSVELAYKQILMTLKPDAKRQEAELLLKLGREVAKSPGKCNEKTMAGVGDLASFNFSVELLRREASQIPDKLRDLLMQLPVGGVSEPVITPQGIRIFMLCERVELSADHAATSPEKDEAAHQAIYKEKLELEAQKYLRNLRREAFIEVRTQ